MATYISIGFSSSDDLLTAFKEAAVMARHQNNQSKNDLVLAVITQSFTAPDNLVVTAAFDNLNKLLKPERFIGLTAPAIIWTQGTENKGVLVLAISSDEIDFGTAIQSDLSLLPLQENGLHFARSLISQTKTSERHGALIFCNTVALNHTLTIRGLQEGLGRAFLMAGAINSGGIFNQKQYFPDALTGLIIGGQASFAASVRHGWQPLGKPRIINDCDSNLIRKIDGKPAVSIYQDYFPKDLTDTPNRLDHIGLLYPLGLNTSRPKEYLIKNPVTVLPDGSLVCQGEIPRGTQVHLMIGDKDACRKATHDAAVEVRDKLHGRHPRIVFVFSSIARKKLLGRSSWQEINQIKDILGLACPVFGMYTCGEIGSVTPLNLQPHNTGILIAAIG